MDGEYWVDIPVECGECNELFHPHDDSAVRRVLCYDCLPDIFPRRVIEGAQNVPALP